MEQKRGQNKFNYKQQSGRQIDGMNSRTCAQKILRSKPGINTTITTTNNNNTLTA